MHCVTHIVSTAGHLFLWVHIFGDPSEKKQRIWYTIGWRAKFMILARDALNNNEHETYSFKEVNIWTERGMEIYIFRNYIIKFAQYGMDA